MDIGGEKRFFALISHIPCPGTIYLFHVDFILIFFTIVSLEGRNRRGIVSMLPMVNMLTFLSINTIGQLENCTNSLHGAPNKA